MTRENYLTIGLVGYIIFVFIQSLFFKFSGSEETVIIFNTIADWMAGLPWLVYLSGPFRDWGGLTIGMAELVASALLLFAATRTWGALLSLGIISGAIFFHLFTPLGVVRVVDADGNTDGGVLFAMACGVWVASATLILLNRRSARRSGSLMAPAGN